MRSQKLMSHTLIRTLKSVIELISQNSVLWLIQPYRITWISLLSRPLKIPFFPAIQSNKLRMFVAANQFCIIEYSNRVYCSGESMCSLTQSSTVPQCPQQHGLLHVLSIEQTCTRWSLDFLFFSVLSARREKYDFHKKKRS